MSTATAKFIFPPVSDDLKRQATKLGNRKRTADVLPLQHLLGRLRMAQLPAHNTGKTAMGAYSPTRLFLSLSLCSLWHMFQSQRAVCRVHGSKGLD